MNYSQYSREHFEQMPLYELRIVGRNLGVKQPTSKVKADLIDEICKILTQKPNTQENTSQEPQKKRQGRPPRTVLTFSDIGAESEEKGEISKIRILEGITTKLEDAFNETPSAVSSCCKNVKKKEEQKTEKKVVCEKKEPAAITEVESTGAEIFSTDVALADVASTEVTNTDVVEIKEGVLEIMPDGYGFLRAKNYESGEHDAYIAAQKIKRSGLRKGDWIKAEAKKNCENRPAGVVNILEVNGRPAEMAFRRKNFDYLTPIYPDHRFKLEIANQQNDYAIRSIDMVAPIGKGQRAMIVSPPKAGKTTLLKKIAHSISHNYPKAHLIVLLIDERPEEVTDMQRSIEGEVVYSTFDEMPEHHTKAAELVLERAKRLVEMGDDVVILMDSLTRLARAYNLTIAPTGRTLSGGIDPGALHSPKRFFGAARNIEFGGSLTIIATALVDTGSRMDDVIYEEFKGTGNMEIHLDRKLSEKRIFPAIDLARSGTRREELLLDQNELQGIWAMRKMLSVGDSSDATENLINMLIKTKTNKEFIEQLNFQLMALQKQGFNLK